MQAASGGLPVVSGVEPRRLAAFAHADMVGYSRLIGEDSAGTSARLARLRRALIDPALGRYGGRLRNTAGDSLMMEFSSVLSAVRFAVEIQTRIPEFDNGEPPERRIRFRMGIDIGDAIPDGQNIHGDAVNVAVRLQSICPPGGVCVAAVVRHHAQGLDLRFEPLGSIELKNIARPVEAFVVHLDRPAVRLTGRRVLSRWIAGGYFEQALRKDPHSVEAMAGAATILIEANRYLNRASTLIARAALVAPNSPDVLAAKFRLLMRQQHDEQAVGTFRQLLDVDSSAAGVAADFIECTYCYRRWGRPEDAVPAAGTCSPSQSARTEPTGNLSRTWPYADHARAR